MKAILWLRRIVAATMLAAFIALFIFAPWWCAKYIAPLAKLQFWPQVVAGAGVTAIVLVLATLLFGRWYCSLICPLGVLQDAAFMLHRKRAQKAAGKVQWLSRYGFVAIFVALGALGFGYQWLEPYGIFGRTFTTVAGAVLGAAIFALAIWRGRVWCNWVCPVGTILGVLSRILPRGLAIDSAKCIGCRKCERNCRAAAISIAGKGEGGSIDPTKCVQCRDCTVICPKGAIRDKAVHHRPPAPVSEEGITRREFLAGSVALGTTMALEAAEEKIFDGGYAEISAPGIDKRNASLKPAGSISIKNFRTKCVGCQLCVKECPNQVLRSSMRLADFGQPEMAFDKGFCTTDCTRCSSVCPSGAILPITPEEKLHTHIGHAEWHMDRCIASTEGVNCTACFRHCPVDAIKRVPGENGALIPVVDSYACIGCGACEHVCPARPLPGMTVKAFEKHRSAKPMGQTEALAEARSLVETGGMSCVVVKDGVIVDAKRGRGVTPLLELLDAKGAPLAGASVVDKVIGRAAAAICVLGRAKKVYAFTASTGAKDFLARHGISCEADIETPQIINRDKTGLCPMEDACSGLDDPGQMVAAIRERLKSM